MLLVPLEFTRDEMARVADLLTWPERIAASREVANDTLNAHKKEQLEKLEVAINDHEKVISDCQAQIKALNDEGSPERVVEITQRIKQLDNTLEVCLDRSDELNREKELLDLEVVDWATGINESRE